MIESWRKCWRDGLAPALSLDGLQALRKALATDDPRLTQGCTTTPPPLQCALDWPCEGACVVGYAGWQGDGLETVGEVEEYFVTMIAVAERRLGDPGAARYLLNWFDGTDRAEARRLLLPEVDREIERRATQICAAVTQEAIP